MSKKPSPDNMFEGLDWNLFMESVGDLLSQKTNSNYNSYGNRKTETKTTIAIAISEQDSLIDWASDLIVDKYRLWFIKRLKVVGKERFIKAANSARAYDDHESRKRVFAFLIKQD